MPPVLVLRNIEGCNRGDGCIVNATLPAVSSLVAEMIMVGAQSLPVYCSREIHLHIVVIV